MKTFRDYIDIIEAAALPPSKKTKTYQDTELPYIVKRVDRQFGSKVLDQTTLYAVNRADLLPKLRAWMDEIGLDPNDEDDFNTVEIG